MGNPDLVIVINNSYAYIERDVPFKCLTIAIKNVCEKYEKWAEDIDEAEQINEIKIYELHG